VPTIYEACGITAPTDLNGVKQKPLEGTSFAYTFDDATAKGRRATQYFELGVNRGLYHEGWMASSRSFVPWQPTREGFDPDKAKWELYNVADDFTQANDLATQQPEKLRQLQDLWWVEAAKYNVLPLDWRGTQRMNAEAMGRPTLGGHSKTLVFYPGQIFGRSPPKWNCQRRPKG
jgi:arylsulfatase A-like enzyme